MCIHMILTFDDMLIIITHTEYPIVLPNKLLRLTGCSLNIVFFPLNFVIFLKSASSAAALVFYLPGVCTH